MSLLEEKVNITKFDVTNSNCTLLYKSTKSPFWTQN